MMFSRLLASAAVLVILLACSATAEAQGLFGGRNLGGSVSAGTRTLGGSGRGAGGLGGTQGGAQVGATQQSQENVGQVTGSERFTRAGRQAGAFVGADSGDTTALRSQTGATGGLGGLGGFQNNALGLGGLGGNQGFNQFMNQGGLGGQFGLNNLNQRNAVRTTLSLGFEPPRPTSDVVTESINRRWASLPAERGLSEVRLSIEEGTAVLRGVVTSAYARDLAERLLALEPGIGDVRNEVEVRDATAESSAR